MNMTKQQVEIAVGTGLEVLGEKSEIVVPVRLNDGVFLLKQLLLAIANGQYGLTPLVQTPPVGPDGKPLRPPAQKPGAKGPSKRPAKGKK